MKCEICNKEPVTVYSVREGKVCVNCINEHMSKILKDIRTKEQ